MTKFTKYNPCFEAPAFSEDAVVEVKTRGGHVSRDEKPWEFIGWEHTGSQLDIMEFRLVRGSMTAQKPKVSTHSMSEIEKDARIFCGLPPYHTWSNLSQGDPRFDTAARHKYGDKAWAAEVKRLVENEDAIRRSAEQAAEIDEIARRRGLAINVAGRERDPNVELRGMLKEVIDVLQCHHRNTHEDLIARVRNYRSQL